MPLEIVFGVSVKDDTITHSEDMTSDPDYPIAFAGNIQDEVIYSPAWSGIPKKLFLFRVEVMDSKATSKLPTCCSDFLMRLGIWDFCRFGVCSYRAVVLFFREVWVGC